MVAATLRAAVTRRGVAGGGVVPGSKAPRWIPCVLKSHGREPRNGVTDARVGRSPAAREGAGYRGMGVRIQEMRRIWASSIWLLAWTAMDSLTESVPDPARMSANSRWMRPSRSPEA